MALKKMMAVFVLSVLTTTASVYSMECTTGIPPQYCQDTHTITVQGDCNNVTSFCSLTSAIDYTTSTSSREQWIIQVNYNHSIDQVSVNVSVSCLIICGIGQQLISFTGGIFIKNTLNNGFLRFINIDCKYVRSAFLFNFDYIQLSNVKVSSGSDWQLSASNITISDSIFSGVKYHTSVLWLMANYSCLLSSVTINNSILVDNGHGNKALILISSPTSKLSVHITDCYIPNIIGNMSTIHVLNAYELTVDSSQFIGQYGSTFQSVIFIPHGNVYKINISNVTIKKQVSNTGIIYMYSNTQAQNACIVQVNIENSLFKENIGSVVEYTQHLQCSSNSSVIIKNNTFTQSQGRMLTVYSVYVLQLSNNTVSYVTNQVFSNTGIFYMRNSSLKVSGRNVFANNIGTALQLFLPYKVMFDKHSSLEFYNNTAYVGGGIALMCNLYSGMSSEDLMCERCLKALLSSKINFTNNQAIFGGAVYIKTSNIGLVCSVSQVVSKVIFSGNQAVTEGNDIMIEYDGSSSSNCTIPNYVDVVYFKKVNLVSMDNQNSITVFPGEYIRFKASSVATCESILYFKCNNFVNSCRVKKIIVHGSKMIIIQRGDLPIYTNLRLTALNEHFTNMSLSVSCLAYTSTIPINIRPCPLSYTYSKTNMTCVPCIDCNSELYVSSVTPYQSVVCLKHGYWYGEGNLIHPCEYPYCKYNLPVCPILNNELYFKLPDTVDEQCNGDRSGILCRGCKDNYTFTYLAVKCVEDKGTQCVGWLIGLVLVSIVINIAVGIFWIVILKWKGGVALGLTLGPVFFLSNVRVLSFGVQPIDIIVSIFSLLILDNSILGYIPVCTPIQSALVYQYFNYIGPLILAVMVGMIYLMANCYSKYNVRLVSPIHAICLLVFVTFWSLASSSIDIVSPVILNNARFSIEPDIPYLHSSVPWYAIILWIIALIILVAMVTLIMLIFITPLLSKWFNMNRIKTFLDFYQSCYKDKWRWYCSVYLIVSVIISITKILNTVDFIIVWSTFVLLLLLLHIVTQPYENKWFNTIDSYLLIDLLMLINYVFDKTEQNFVFAYVLVALPFLYVTVIMFVALGYNGVPKKWKIWLANFVKVNKSQCPSSKINPLRVDDCYPVVVPSTEIGMLTGDDYREGLSLCSDQDNYYGAFDS